MGRSVLRFYFSVALYRLHMSLQEVVEYKEVKDKVHTTKNKT